MQHKGIAVRYAKLAGLFEQLGKVQPRVSHDLLVLAKGQAVAGGTPPDQYTATPALDTFYPFTRVVGNPKMQAMSFWITLHTPTGDRLTPQRRFQRLPIMLLRLYSSSIGCQLPLPNLPLN